MPNSITPHTWTGAKRILCPSLDAAVQVHRGITPSVNDTAGCTSTHRMLFGAEVLPSGSVRFRLFAPAAGSVRLALEDRPTDLVPLQKLNDGWYEVVTPAAHAGSLYRFLLPDGTAVPDPASRYQPHDVHGPSEVVDPASYTWTDVSWQGRPWSEAVLYELHVGTFTPAGTFAAAAAKLDHLARIGITAIELMCIADFPGLRNWGYDSVLMYAPDSSYGRPDDLKAFIDAAHHRGIQVILDVVYNHFGPEGNYLPRYFPQLLTSDHTTPWGDALNFDEDSANGGVCAKQVRELILHNALYWVEEFHIDGLRLDASHTIIDHSRLHVLDEMAIRVREFAAAQLPPRHVHLIREDEDNVSNALVRNAEGIAERYTAQWNHDMSHLLGAGMRSVFDEPGDGSPDDETRRLSHAIAEGFILAAEDKESRGEGEAHRCEVPPTAFISFVQTHDLIGNRIAGERIHALIPPQHVHAVMAVLLLVPQVPMLFMGDEFAATSPFPYFCDFHGQLGHDVGKGRREFLQKLHNASDEELAKSPDPQAEETFLSAKLNWQELEDSAHSDWLPWYRNILRVRLESIAPLISRLGGRCGQPRILAANTFEVAWMLNEGRELRLSANLRPFSWNGFTAVAEGAETIWLEGQALSPAELAAYSVRWTLS